MRGRRAHGDRLRPGAGERGGRLGGEAGGLEPLEKRGALLPPDLFRHAVQVSEPVEVLSRGVAAIEARLVRHDAEPRPHRVQAFGQAEAIELDEARIRTEDSAEASKRRRLSRAVLPQENDDLATFD